MIEKLLKKLIEIPSISGQERKIARFVFSYLKNNGLKPKLLLNNDNVYCEIGKGKRTLLLNSHLDTVPPSDSWTMKPFKAKELNGKIYGLGACDTKGSLAAMMAAIIDLNNSKEKLDGKVGFLATANEEAGSAENPSGLEILLRNKRINYDAIVIGEPTSLNICVAQRGIIRLKVLVKGKAGHVALGGVNAIHQAVDEIQKLKSLKLNKKHKLLGFPVIQVTLISGGIKANVVPDHCEFTLHIRSTPNYPNNYLINLIKKKIKSKVKIESERYFPKEIGIKEKIVRAAQKANSHLKIAGFPAASDFAFVNKPGIILGPGDLKQAHSANEFVKISQLKKAKEIYKKVIQSYFENEN